VNTDQRAPLQSNMRFMNFYDRETYRRWYSEGFWTSDTLLDAIARHAAVHPKRDALVEGSKRLDYSQLLKGIDAVAVRLHEAGAGAGDVVAVQLPNSLHLAVTILALLRIGAVYLALNPSYDEYDLRRIFRVGRPKLHIFPRQFNKKDYPALAHRVAEQSGGGVFPIAVDLDDEEWLGVHGATRGGPVPGFAAPDPDALFLLGSTSGSTGEPKLYSHIQNTQFNEARTLNRLLDVGEKDAFLVCFPMTHRGALMFGLLQSLAAGSKLVILREYDPYAIVRSAAAEHVTALFLIPMQAFAVLAAANELGLRCESVRLMMLSGAPVPPELVRQIRTQWPNCSPITGYGASEDGFSTITRLDDPPEQLTTCGRPIPGQEVCIDTEGRNADGVGEILIRGAFLFGGYYADQHQTNAAFKGTWFRTGDLGRQDADGTLHLTGRLKNVIIRGGLNIHAEEVENILLQHEAVAEVLAIGLPDDRLGERLAVCVVPRQGASFDAGVMLEHLTQVGITKFKIPEFFALMDALPRNAVGKQDRIALRKRCSEIAFSRVAS